MFVEYAAGFVKTPASKVVVEYLKAYKSQSKLQFNEFMALCSTLMLDRNVVVVEKCKDELMNAPLSGWIELIERTASTVHLRDKGSTQEAINEFI